MTKLRAYRSVPRGQRRSVLVSIYVLVFTATVMTFLPTLHFFPEILWMLPAVLWFWLISSLTSKPKPETVLPFPKEIDPNIVDPFEKRVAQRELEQQKQPILSEGRYTDIYRFVQRLSTLMDVPTIVLYVVNGEYPYSVWISTKKRVLFLTVQLLNALPSDSMRIAYLAHELAHFRHNHAQIVYRITYLIFCVQLLIRAYFASIGQENDDALLLCWLISCASAIAIYSFARILGFWHERAADRLVAEHNLAVPLYYTLLALEQHKTTSDVHVGWFKWYFANAPWALTRARWLRKHYPEQFRDLPDEATPVEPAMVDRFGLRSVKDGLSASEAEIVDTYLDWVNTPR